MSDVADRLVQAFNRRDLDAFVAGYPDGILIEDAQGEALVRGTAELRARYEPMFDGSPDLHCEVLNRIAVGEYIIDEERVTGRGPTAERLAVVYRVRDGVVDRERILR